MTSLFAEKYEACNARLKAAGMCDQACQFRKSEAGRIASGVDCGRLSYTEAEQVLAGAEKRVAEMCTGELVDRGKSFPPMCPADPNLEASLAISEL